MDTELVANAIDAVGELVTLRRLLAAQQFVSVQTRARMDTPAAQNDALPGGGRQFHQQFRISNRDIAARQWPGPPKRGDQIVTAEGSMSTVQSVDTLKIGDTVVGFILQTMGSR